MSSPGIIWPVSERSGRLDFPTPPPFYRGGSGPPLVLIHGFTDTWRAWQLVIPELEKHHDLFAPTLPGHFGAAPWETPEPLHLPQFIDAIEKQLDDAGITTAHVVGNSLGGWMALELAARGRAESVVALCPGGGWIPHNRDERRILRYFKRSYAVSRHAAPRAEWIAKHRRLRSYSMRDLVSYPERITAEAFVDSLRGCAKCDIAPAAMKLGRTEGFGDLGQIDCPVRIAWGSKDRIMRWPSCYIRFPKLIPGVELVRLEGLGHIPMWDAPDIVVQTILEVTLEQGQATAKRNDRHN